MGNWYRVVKTIKGHRYLYEQRSWREGDRVRTECRYVGRAHRKTKGSLPPISKRRTEVVNTTNRDAVLRLPPFIGKAYRAESTNFPKSGSALDLIEYDERELGNVGEFEHLTPNMRRELSKIPVREITWVTKTRKAAERYANADPEAFSSAPVEGVREIRDLGRKPLIIADDGDGGYLILKDRSHSGRKRVRG